MDYKIKFGLICVIALFMVCKNVQTTSTGGPDVTTVAGSTVTSGAGGSGKTNTTTSVAKPATDAGGVKGTSAGPVVTTTPAPIKCKLGTCNDTTCAALKTTCDSDTSRGCQVVTDDKGVHTYSCVTKAGDCTQSEKTKCCTKNNCNPLERSSASKVIGNLVSAFLMMVLIKFL